MVERVTRGNLDAENAMRSLIASWNDNTFDGDDKWARRREVEKLCKLVADLKLQSMRSSLVARESVSEPTLSVYVVGALSALGDEGALGKLHHQSRHGKGVPQVLAVEMCRYLTDPESTTIVANAANSERRDLRASATKELLTFLDRREETARVR